MHHAAAALSSDATTAPMSITTRFGAVELDPERIVTFPTGPLGFADRCRFILADGPDPRGAFKLLQCLDDPELGFLVLPIDPGAGPISSDDLHVACRTRGLDWAALAVLAIVTVRPEAEGVRFSVNLKAPLLIDTRRRSGCQHVLASDRYQIREPLPLGSRHGAEPFAIRSEPARPERSDSERSDRDRAVRASRRGSRGKPADARLARAERLRRQGRLRQAIAECRKALDRAPDDPSVLLLLARLLTGTDRDQACALATRAAALADDDPDRLAACAGIIGESSPALALELYQRAVDLAPHQLGWWLPIAKFAFVLNRLDLSIEAAGRVLERHPDQPEAGVLLASALLRRRDFTRMAATLKRLEATGGQAANVANLAGAMLVQQGRVEESLATMRRVRELAPGSAMLQMSRVMSLNYDPELSRAELLDEHRSFGEMFAGSVPPVARGFDRDRSPERRLRIGYMSPDFRSHSVAYFALPLFEAFDRERFDVIAYAHVPAPDEVTARLCELATEWRDVAGVSDRQLARAIHQDRIDILVDLAGLTRNSRLLACTGRPAPIQMSYLGYPNTTGLAAVDYRITDHVAEPDDADDFYTETLIRLPRCFLAFAPPGHAPEITPPPVLQNGYVTFGSFNNLAKVNRQVVELWSRVLRSVPGSRLLLKASGTGDGTAQEHLRAAFRAAGVDAGRLEFAPFAATAAEHLGRYAGIDVALDTFPYNGTTTTCEALWMGVPVVTLMGERHASRVGASLLRAVGLPAGIASGADDYVATARLMAEQPQLLVALRGNLRAETARSPLCDGQGHARALEEAYRAVWRIWCQQA